MIGPQSVLAWVMLVGFAVTAPLTVSNGIPDGLGARQLLWIAVSGIGNVAGLLFVYEALRVGKVSIVAPITSTEGAIAAVLAVAAGERARGRRGLHALADRPRRRPGEHHARRRLGDPLRASLLAAGAASFGARACSRRRGSARHCP